MKKVLLIYGGNSTEHEVSIKSAETIKSNIDTSKYILDSVLITRENEWIFNNNKIDNIINFIKNYDLVFPITHGENGEDGKLQGMLDLFNIKYVGSKCGASYICMDKARTKEILNQYNIPQVPYQMYNKNKEIVLEYPIIVKPSNGGSSIGISIANNKKELKNSIKKANQYDHKIVLEKFLTNPIELECAVLKNGKNIITEIGEIKHHNIFYDYDTKYNNDSICTNLNPNINDKEKELIKEYAKEIFNILELDNLARIDFLYDNGNIYLNEINTLPGFTNISMYPQLIMNKGISYKKLITILIENAK